MHEHAYPSFAGSPPRRPKRSGRRREVSQLGYFSIIMTSFERHSTGRPLFTGRFVKGRTSCNRLVSLFDLVANSLLPPWRQRTGSSNRHRRRNLQDKQICRFGPSGFAGAAAADGARAIPWWRHKPEVVFRMGSRCRRRVF